MKYIKNGKVAILEATGDIKNGYVLKGQWNDGTPITNQDLRGFYKDNGLDSTWSILTSLESGKHYVRLISKYKGIN